MADNWASYFCKVNDKLASIFLNLGIRESIPDKQRPHLLWVWIYFKSPRPDGLSSNEEFQTLSSIEDSLVAAVEKKCNAVVAGRITTCGRREFYFYAPNDSHLQEAVDLGLADFGNYRYWLGHKDDPTWTQYLQVLYPSEVQRQKIENRKVLDVLEKHGDTLATARDVMHWAYFKTSRDLESYKKAVIELGYSIDGEPWSEERQEYGLRFNRSQAVTTDEIDEAVAELFQLARRHNGGYDGWETQVISDKPDQVQ